MANALLETGFNVVLHGRNETKIKCVARDMCTQFPARQIKFVVADASVLGSHKAVVAAVEEVIGTGGVLKILVNNVGGNTCCANTYTLFQELTTHELTSTMNLNAVFPTSLTKALLDWMAMEPSLIINIGSLAGLYGVPYCGLYSSCKSLNNSFSSALTGEMVLQGTGVEVVGVLVGEVNSPGNRLGNAGPLVLSTKTMAADILRVVGCGESLVAANWRHAISQMCVSWLPTWLRDRALRLEMHARRMEQDKQMH